MLTVDGDEASTVRTIIPVVIQTGGSYYFGGVRREVLLLFGAKKNNESNSLLKGQKYPMTKVCCRQAETLHEKKRKV